MSKQGLLKIDGCVTENLSNGFYKVVLENGYEIKAYLGGKIRTNNIRILVGDTVTIELSPYDLNNGRIVYRKKNVE